MDAAKYTVAWSSIAALVENQSPRSVAEIEMVYTAQGSPWTESRCTVANVSKNGDNAEVYMKQPCFASVQMKPCGQSEFDDRSDGHPVSPHPSSPSHPHPIPPPHFIQSKLNAPHRPTHLTQCTGTHVPALIENTGTADLVPGSWYLKRGAAAAAADVAVYYPLAGEKVEEAVMPILSTLVAATELSDATFEGITYEHTTWDRPNVSRGGQYVGVRFGQEDGENSRLQCSAAVGENVD